MAFKRKNQQPLEMVEEKSIRVDEYNYFVLSSFKIKDLEFFDLRIKQDINGNILPSSIGISFQTKYREQILAAIKRLKELPSKNIEALSLSKNKTTILKVLKQEYNDTVNIHLREFFEKDEEWRPTKKAFYTDISNIDSLIEVLSI